MINLFYSESYWGHSQKMNGPKKVVTNLIESLGQEEIDYSINEETYKNNFLIQYDYAGHENHSKIELETSVIGPQIWFFDEHAKFLVENPDYYKTIVVPSQWVKYLAVEKFGYREDKISIWPVGIKTNPIKKDIKQDCFIYAKRRSSSELNAIENFLQEKGISYTVVVYGNYNEGDLAKLSSESKFCFLLNGTESQGIAVQEIMSYDVPLFVWDVESWDDQGTNYSVPATSVPYWSDECGMKFYSQFDLEKTFDEFYSRIEEYTPRNFIEQNLSYKKSIDILMEIFNAD